MSSTQYQDKGYNGNSNLPSAGREVEWTQYSLMEVDKCMNDPVHFCESYMKIVSVDDGLIPFNLFPFQREILAAYPTELKILLNQSRQSGKTSIVTAIICHYMIFNEMKRIGILANKESQAIEILDRIKMAFEYLPSWLKPGVVEWNKKRIEFDNGTWVMAGASSSDSIRGKSLSMLFVDELAFVPGWNDFSASVLPVLSSGKNSRLLFASTPMGLNHFYVYCELAKQGKNGFWYKEVPWHMVPGRDEEWKKKVLEDINGDVEKFDAEYNCQFLGSSGTLISGWKLKELLPKTPIQAVDGLYQYIKPHADRRYAITVDVSRGKGLDYSAFHVIDVTQMPYQQVMVYRSNKVTPMDYASIIHKAAMAYNKAQVLVEINDIGQQVADLLFHDYEYEGVIHTENKGRAGKTISSGFGSSTGIDSGIRTTKPVKNVGCSTLKLLIEQNQLTLHDAESIYELSRFSRKGSSYAAEEGCNDDLVMGLVLFAWMSIQPNFKDMMDIGTLQAIRDQSEQQIEDDLVPFGYIVNGVDDYEEDDESIWDLEKRLAEEAKAKNNSTSTVKIPTIDDVFFADSTVDEQW